MTTEQAAQEETKAAKRLTRTQVLERQQKRTDWKKERIDRNPGRSRVLDGLSEETLVFADILIQLDQAMSRCRSRAGIDPRYPREKIFALVDRVLAMQKELNEVAKELWGMTGNPKPYIVPRLLRAGNGNTPAADAGTEETLKKGKS